MKFDRFFFNIVLWESKQHMLFIVKIQSNPPTEWEDHNMFRDRQQGLNYFIAK